jgi:hypothetical protein
MIIEQLRTRFRQHYSHILERRTLFYSLLAAVTLISLALAYVLDVWLIGALAAAVVSSFAQAGAVIAGRTPPPSMTEYLWSHPFQTAWSWLTEPALSTATIRMVWIVLNLALAAVAVFYCMLYWKSGQHKRRDRRYTRDIHRLRFKKIDYNLQQALASTPSDQIFLGMDDHRKPVTIPVSKMTQHIYVLGHPAPEKPAWPCFRSASRRSDATCR